MTQPGNDSNAILWKPKQTEEQADRMKGVGETRKEFRVIEHVTQ